MLINKNETLTDVMKSFLRGRGWAMARVSLMEGEPGQRGWLRLEVKDRWAKCIVVRGVSLDDCLPYVPQHYAFGPPSIMTDELNNLKPF